jgi:hypothetical protein
MNETLFDAGPVGARRGILDDAECAQAKAAMLGT